MGEAKNSGVEGGWIPDFDSLWDYDRPGETEKRFRKLLPSAEASGNVSYLAQLLTQIARAEGLQRKFEDAHRTLDRVETLLSKADARAKIRYLLERGRVLNSSERVDEARPLFLQALDLALAEKEDLYAVDAAHMMAIVEPTEKRLQWNLKALSLAEDSTDEKAKKWRGSLYNNIGWTYFDMKQYEEALFMFEKALAFREQQGDPAAVRVAKWSVGKALRMMDHTEEALDIQQELLQEYDSIGERSGYVYEEIAECLLIMGWEQEAQARFAAAYEELSRDPWLAANEQDRLNRLKELGKIDRSIR